MLKRDKNTLSNIMLMFNLEGQSFRVTSLEWGRVLVVLMWKDAVLQITPHDSNPIGSDVGVFWSDMNDDEIIRHACSRPLSP